MCILRFKKHNTSNILSYQTLLSVIDKTTEKNLCLFFSRLPVLLEKKLKLAKLLKNKYL